MRKYLLEWADGTKSAIPMTKEQTVTAINNWVKKEAGWSHITIRNIKNNESDTIFETDNLAVISGMNV